AKRAAFKQSSDFQRDFLQNVLPLQTQALPKRRGRARDPAFNHVGGFALVAQKARDDFLIFCKHSLITSGWLILSQRLNSDNSLGVERAKKPGQGAAASG